MESTIEIIREKTSGGNIQFLGKMSTLKNILRTKSDEKLIINIHKFFKGAAILSIPHEYRKDISEDKLEFAAVQLTSIFGDLLSVFHRIDRLSMEYGYLLKQYRGIEIYTDLYITINDVEFALSPNPYGKVLYLKNPLRIGETQTTKVFHDRGYVTRMVGKKTHRITIYYDSNISVISKL